MSDKPRPDSEPPTVPDGEAARISRKRRQEREAVPQAPLDIDDENGEEGEMETRRPIKKIEELRATLMELRDAADEAVAAADMIDRLRTSGADVAEDELILRHHLRMMGEALIAVAAS